MTQKVRLLPYASLDGATNMAADEAMLESASERGIASLRFYAWSEPTLTIGYFQPSEGRTQVEELHTIPWLRRSTGGAGILHHRELTYSFALPNTREWKSESWICRFHHLVEHILVEAGVPAKLVICGEEQKLGDVLCFLHQTPGDMLVAGAKVAGSAQRKLRGAMLQHGSLLLRRSEFAPQLEGMEDLAGRDLFSAETLSSLLAQSFARDTGSLVEEGEWTDDERLRIAQIRAEKYANPEWNNRR